MSQQILTNKNAQDKLREMIRDAGQSPDSLNLGISWDVFIEFCNIPIDTESDGVIVQWGPEYNYTHSREREHVGFYYSVLRQFDDDNMEFEQLELCWYFARDEALDQFELANSGWCFAKGDPDEHCDVTAFLRKQRQTKLFQIVSQRSPIRTRISQENTG